MFDLEALRSLLTGSDAAFLEVLIESRLVRYDWDRDIVWTWRGANTPPSSDEDVFHISGETLHEAMYEVKCAMDWPTSAGLIVDLLSCNVTVQIATLMLLKSELLETWLKHAKIRNPDADVNITQFQAH